MGYYGSLSFNGLYIPEQKFSGDYMSEYARTYNLTKKAEITEKEITDVETLLHKTDVEYRLITALQMKQIFDELLNNRHLNLFDEEDNFIGHIKLCASDMFANTISAYFIDKRDMERFNTLQIPWTNTWKRDRNLYFLKTEEQLTFLKSLKHIDYICIYSVFCEQGEDEIKDAILHIQHKQDVRNLIDKVQERIIELSAKQIKEAKNIRSTENIMEALRSKLKEGRKVTVQYERSQHNIIIQVEGENGTGELGTQYGSVYIVGYDYSLLPLFRQVGTDNWSSACEIHTYEEMEKFIALFPAVKRSNIPLENKIIDKWNEVKAKNEPLNFSIGGSY